MHNACMATKTISLKVEAYERLRRARRYPGESFTEVVMRAVWPEIAPTGAELLEHCRRHGPYLAETEVDRVDEAKRSRRPPEDKWAGS